MTKEVGQLKVATICVSLMDVYMAMRRIIEFDSSPQARALNKLDKIITELRKEIE